VMHSDFQIYLKNWIISVRSRRIFFLFTNCLLVILTESYKYFLSLVNS
jgi:hypothetical protein